VDTFSESEINGILEAIWRFEAFRPFDPKEADLVTRWEAGQLPHRCVFTLGPRSFQVKVYFAGKQRSFGTFQSAENACRIADLAIMRLHRFKTRHRKPLTEADYNLTPAMAKRDFDDHPELRSLFIQLESAVPDATRPANRRSYQTVSQEFRSAIELLRSDIAEIKALLTKQNGANT
jgi:hypothetical protein